MCGRPRCSWCRDAEGPALPSAGITCNTDPASVHRLPVTAQAVFKKEEPGGGMRFPYGSGGDACPDRLPDPQAYDRSLAELLHPLIVSLEVRPGYRRPDILKCVIEIVGT